MPGVPDLHCGKREFDGDFPAAFALGRQGERPPNGGALAGLLERWEGGVMRGVISTLEADTDKLVAKAREGFTVDTTRLFAWMLCGIVAVGFWGCIALAVRWIIVR